MTMKQIKLLIAVAAVTLAATAAAQDPQTLSRSELRENIEQQEDAIDDHNEAIKDIDKKIKEHKDAIKELEKQKKEHEKQVKLLAVARKTHVETHDTKLFDEEVLAVLRVKYNKSEVDKALKKFEGVETKDVLKKKDLVKKYRDYSKDLYHFLLQQKTALNNAGWQQQLSNSVIYKDFEKELKDTKYFKIYNKKATDSSIPYLDGVMDKIYRFKSDGLKDKGALDSIINMVHVD